MKIIEDLSTKEINKAVRELYAFQQGKRKPIKTSYEHLNNICHGGIFPGTILTICARSGHGKSYTANTIKEDILRDKSNANVLLFNWEMTIFNLMLVEIRKRTGLTYQEILNLKEPTEEQTQTIKEVADSFRNERLTIEDKSLTPKEYDEYTRHYLSNNDGVVVIITDHIGITKGSDKRIAIDELLEVQNQIKLDYSDRVSFINLAQLNREVDSTFRSTETNPLNLRLSPSYIRSSDSLMLYSDVILGQVIPEKFNMATYTAINTENERLYGHLEPHLSDKTHKTRYTLLRSENRIYYDYIKTRFEDGQPTLYCALLREDELPQELPPVEPNFDLEF